jgi:xylulokinase
VTDRILACDVGTSSLKLAVFDRDGTIAGFAARPYATRAPAAGYSEQDPADWLSGLAGSVAELDGRGHPAGVAAIAFTGQMSALVPVDGSGTPLRPAMIWSDVRASREAAEIAAAIGTDAYFDLSGNPPAATYPAAKARWLLRHEPEVLSKTAKILQPKDFIIARLTGAMAIDPSDASCTGFLDISGGHWAPALVESAGISPELLPELAPSTAIVGKVSAAGAAWSGLPEGLPVVLGGGDGPTTALGVGAAEEGRIYACLGTSAWMSRIATRPSADPARRLVTYRHVLPGLFAPTGSTQNCGNVLDWLVRTLGSAERAGEVITRVLEDVAAGADGLLFLPFLHGERTPFWDPELRGAILGLGYAHGRDHIVRAALEGIAFELRLILDVFREGADGFGEIAVVGGIAENAAVRRLLSEVLAIPVVPILQGAHTTVRGAAMLGALALGIVPSPAEARRWVAVGEKIVPPRGTNPRLESARRRFATAATAIRSIR